MSAAAIKRKPTYAVVSGSFSAGISIECIEDKATATLTANCCRAFGILAEAVEIQLPSSLGRGIRNDLMGEHIVAFSGPPGDAISLFGPFVDYDRAERFAERYRDDGEEWAIWRADYPTHPHAIAKPGTADATLFLLQAAVASQKQHAEAMAALERALVGATVTQAQANVIVHTVKTLAAEITTPHDALEVVEPKHVQSLADHFINGHNTQAQPFQISEEDVANVLSSNALDVADSQGKSFEAMANEIFHRLDFEAIEQAALFGDGLGEQTDYAHDEIARQLREMGMLEPLRPVPAQERG